MRLFLIFALIFPKLCRQGIFRSYRADDAQSPGFPKHIFKAKYILAPILHEKQLFVYAYLFVYRNFMVPDTKVHVKRPSGRTT